MFILKYCTTASPELLATVVTWIVRSFLFTAMKSQLSEGQVCSQFFHGILRDKQRFIFVTVADFTV